MTHHLDGRRRKKDSKFVKYFLIQRINLLPALPLLNSASVDSIGCYPCKWRIDFALYNGDEDDRTMAEPLVFLVDDEIEVVKMVALALQIEGYRVRSFTDPREVLAASSEMAPDLLFTDVVMPHMNGIELADAVVQRWPGCKVLLMSGHGDDWRHGKYRLLDKPFKFDEFTSAVSDVMGSDAAGSASIDRK